MRKMTIDMTWHVIFGKNKSFLKRKNVLNLLKIKKGQCYLFFFK